ncbi:PilW family protein [Bacillus solimangrovi]|uniref:Prepilin-type N-terminal cleavage/methylation domain-containing protein n=1 Tax=Bacillus solimangrovi TaxID=1305675 RepID=A0A1E5LBI4_9BACI|nr:prepilin-type N-terminal cleavage/methylation domain-containing protein [Bacillus solimangrovi]OEH91447.1 hypothetical protein BFG57_04855 [Bacillus solimangrovi]
MKKYADKLRSQHGLTLVELLLTITIFTMILGMVYGVLITGMEAYRKIAIEGNLRDQADYVVAMIMEEIYETPIDHIEDCGTSTNNNCVKIINREYAKADIIDTYSIVDQNYLKDNKEEKIIKFEGNDSVIIDQDTIHTEGVEFTDSTIEIICEERQRIFNSSSGPVVDSICTNALITINLNINNGIDEDSFFYTSLTLKSRFSY